MDQRRIILFLVFSFALVMLWDAWLKDQAPAPSASETSSQQQQTADTGLPTPSAGLLGDPALPSVNSPAQSSASRSIVRTDMVVAEISAQGGEIVRMELKHHAAGKDGDANFVLFDDGARHVYSAQTGLIGDGLPNHRTMYSMPEGEQVLQEGQDTLTLRLVAPEENGVQVTKVMTFHRGSYLIDIDYEIVNNSDAGVSGHAYFQFARDGQPAEAVEVFGVRTFTGPAFYTTEEKYQKVDFDDIERERAKFTRRADNGWAAMVQHYFVGAWLPRDNIQREFFARKLGTDLYSAGVILPMAAVTPGQSGTIGTRLYAGPQEQDHLSSIAEGLDLVVDYGWLTMIAAPLFWVLSWFHSLTGNWGWSIILVTVVIKLVFFPLSAASYKSMAKMRVLGPRMQKLKELYGNDKQRMQQEVMDMYRKEKINPLGGCLPILVQIPVFIALYWVLLGSVEVRHAPWLGWIQDLSSKDPYFILPVLMGASMLVQMKLNPAPPDPIQAKIMMALPIVFTFMFMWFPSGLVLYWVVNNVLSIAQQWQITRMIESGKKQGGKAA